MLGKLIQRQQCLPLHNVVCSVAQSNRVHQSNFSAASENGKTLRLAYQFLFVKTQCSLRLVSDYCQ